MTITFDKAFQLAADRLEGVDANAEARRRSLAENAGPLDLVCRLNPQFVRTDYLELLSVELERVITTPGDRLIVSIGSQLGKSTLVEGAVLRRLQHDPSTPVLYASYAQDLALEKSQHVRDYINTYGSDATDDLTGEPAPDLLGLALADGNAAAGRWMLKGGAGGGVIARGLGSGSTGRPVRLLVVDDPIKDREEANSARYRQRAHNWMSAVAETRLPPHASAIVLATRWHELDLSGWLIANDRNNRWRVLNIPALSDGKTPDALGRPPGVWLKTIWAHSEKDWQEKREAVGEVDFWSIYQGSPTPLEGGVFKRDWFDMWRVDEPPPGCLPPVVVVDPADNPGSGDEAGIVVGCSHPASGKAYLLDDLSGAMTVGKWARLALLTCVRKHAPTLAFEKSLSQLTTRIREAWADVHRQATALHKTGGDVDAAVERLTRPDDSAEVREQVAHDVAELADIYDAVRGFGESGPRIKALVARGSKTTRMQLVAPAVETGRFVMVGKHPELEHQACFPAGTLVATRSGLMAIETIAPGDQVATRRGWRPVEWAGQTGVLPCVEVETASGRTLRLTEDHRVWVEGHGWMFTKHLRPGHRMLECLAPEPVRSSSSTDSPTVSTTTATTSTSEAGDTRRGCCTETCGSKPTGAQFPRVGTFTTSTTTARTTTPVTSSPSRLVTTAESTPTNEASQCGRPSSAAPLAYGSGPRSLPPIAPAFTAASSISQPVSGPSTALPTAERQPIRTAGENLHDCGTTRPVAVRSTSVVRVDLRPSSPEPVYDLTVGEDHEFFANGLLVHNCTWQEGQDSPDRVDAMTHLVGYALGMSGVATLERAGPAAPRVPTSSAGLRNTAGRVPTRSMRR